LKALLLAGQARIDDLVPLRDVAVRRKVRTLDSKG
jgi:hypothetical protein